uniref:Uncharacterized protein n=1 Tax=Acrobeloides nanus TaxID=290746 RepID=A0A914D7G9_9BILA
MKVKIRAGKKPVIFSIQLPIEKSISNVYYDKSKFPKESLHMPYEMKLPSYDDIILSPASPNFNKNFDQHNDVKIV